MDRQAKSTRNRILRGMLSMALVVMWSVSPIICAPSVEASTVHSHGETHSAANEHFDGDHEDRNFCCTAVVNAKFLLSASVVVPPVKALSLELAKIAILQETVSTPVELKRSQSSTGPPRSVPRRFLSYSPLAPPIRVV